MATELRIFTPPGMFGASPDEDPFTTAMRVVALALGDPGEWSTKYGGNYENDTFLMHRYCWCDFEDEPPCQWCHQGRFTLQVQSRHYYDPPNFWFKPTDFRVTWYKYIGREMRSNHENLPPDWLSKVLASHPAGKTVEQALAEYAEHERKAAEESAKFGAFMASPEGMTAMDELLRESSLRDQPHNPYS